MSNISCNLSLLRKVGVLSILRVICVCYVYIYIYNLNIIRNVEVLVVIILDQVVDYYQLLHLVAYSQ